MFQIPRPSFDDLGAPDEFRTVLATRPRWWRAGNSFHPTLRSALHEEFVYPVQRVLWWPYVTLAERYGGYDVLYVRRGTQSWHHWARCFTQAGAERCMRRSAEAFRDIEMKVAPRGVTVQP